jgi:hypothetical protein
MEITAGWQIIITGLIGAATVGGTWYTLRASRDKIRADTAATLTKSAADWITLLNVRLAKLEQEVIALETELEEVRATNRILREWAKVLVAEVYEAGGEPTSLQDIPTRRG